MQFVVRMTNKVTGEKQINLMGMESNTKENREELNNNIRVYMGHRNRLNWGYGNGTYTIEEYTDEAELEAQVWMSGTSKEEVLALRAKLNEGPLF